MSSDAPMPAQVSSRARARLRNVIAALEGEPQGELAGLLDLRGLPAPEPLEQALLAAQALGPSQSVVVRTPRLPKLLLQRLRERGFFFATEALSDGSALVYVERP